MSLDYPSEELIASMAEDFAAAEELWREFPEAVAAFLIDWADRFQQASPEQKEIMAGDFTAEVLLFIATWEFSATKIGRLRIPPIKIGPAPSAAPVVAIAGGGSATLERAAALSIPGTTVGVGGPVGVGGVAVSQMAGRGRKGGSEPTWDHDPVGVLRKELSKEEEKSARFLRSDDGRCLDNSTAGKLTEKDRIEAMEIRRELLLEIIPRRTEALDELIDSDPAKEAIKVRGYTNAEQEKNLLDDVKWLKSAPDEHKRLAYRLSILASTA